MGFCTAAPVILFRIRQRPTSADERASCSSRWHPIASRIRGAFLWPLTGMMRITSQISHKNALSTYYKLSTDLNTCVGLLQYPQALRLSHQLTDHVHNFSKSFSQSEITQALLTHLRVLIYNKDFKAAIALSGKIQEPENLKFYMQTEFLMLKWVLYFCMRDYGKACTIYQSLSVLQRT